MTDEPWKTRFAKFVEAIEYGRRTFPEETYLVQCLNRLADYGMTAEDAIAIRLAVYRAIPGWERTGEWDLSEVDGIVDAVLDRSS